MSKFHLPPVESALAVGKRSPIGSNAMANALEEMMPGAFVKVPVEHPIVEALVIREVHLRRVPQSQLVPTLLKHAENYMAETEMLHIDIDMEVRVSETLEL